jgi:serine/threonine protein kinase
MADFEEKVGRYKILKVIGKGAFGIIYLAEDPKIQRLVALKTIIYEKGMNEEEKSLYKDKIVKEAQAAGKLIHPNIVTLFDVFDFQGKTYISMEYVDGETLDEKIKREGKFDPKSAVNIAIACLKALSYAHCLGIVHRDLKPSNIMILKDGRVKITDFGLAKMTGTKLSQEGFLLGTPHYMSPEQIDNKPLDGRSDIFSMGIILYEMISGVRPFEGETISSILKQILFEEPKLRIDKTGSCPEQLWQVITKSLEKEPEKRFQSADEFISALKNLNLEESQNENKTFLPPPPPKILKKQPRYSVDWKTVTIAGASGALFTILIIVILQFLILKEGNPIPLKNPPSEEVLPTPIEVKTDPPKALLFLDGKEVTIPIISPKDRKKHKLVAKKGCLSQEVEISYKTKTPLYLKLTEGPFQFKVDSEPKGARILIDGKETDFLTPAFIPRTDCKSFTLTITMDGYSDVTREIDPSELDSVIISLSQKSAEGKVKFRSDDPQMKFYLNGKLVAGVGDTISLPEGNYEIEVVNEAVLGRRKATLKVFPKETTQFYAEPFKTGRIFLFGKPEEDGKVQVDGKYFGELPITGDKMVSSGKHSFVAISSKGRKVVFEWIIKEGEQKKIVDFQKRKAINF